MDPEKTHSESISWSQIGTRTGWVAGVFTLVVTALLVINHFQGKAADPLNSPQLAEMKASLSRNPGDERLKNEIRALDLGLRQKHARHVAFGEFGAWMLIGGALVFFVSYKPSVRRKLPRPERASAAAQAREAAQIRLALAGFALLAGGTAWLVSSTSTTDLVRTSAATSAKLADAQPEPAKLAPFPSPEELKRNWPRFRGPGGIGISTHTNVPVAWNSKTGENILWKTAVPTGPSSPVIWGDKLFLTSATATNRSVLCFETGSGKLLWQKPVDAPRTNNAPPTVMEDSGGYGPSTPYVDGRRVYAIFANGDLAAFDLNGTPAWTRNLGMPENGYGYATSLEMYQNRLLVQFDQGEAKDGKSRLLALDSETGKTVWQSEPRPVPSSWATPIVIQNGNRTMVITTGNPWVIAYNPSDGKEIWRAKALYGEVLPSPVFAAGLVFTAQDGDKLSAIKPDGTGDVSATNILWTAQDGLPDVVSPVSDGERLYLISPSGTLTCYDAKSGNKLWEHETELAFQSSPVIAGDRLYLISDKGVGLVLQTGAEYKELGHSDLEEKILASPAFTDGRIFIRGQTNLFCVGQKSK